MIDKIDKISRVVAVGWPILLFLAALRSMLYYGYFGVDIFSYIDFIEVITLFFGDIYFLVQTFTCAIFMTFFFDKKLSVDGLIKEKLSKKINSDIDVTGVADRFVDAYNKSKEGLRAMQYLFGFLSLIGLVILVCGFAIDLRYLVYVGIWIFVVFALIGLSIEALVIYSHQTEYGFNLIWFIVFTVYLVMASVIITYIDVIGVLYSPKNKIVYLDDHTLILNTKSKYYVGRTNKYIFCVIDDSVHAIPVSRIKEEVIFDDNLR